MDKSSVMLLIITLVLCLHITDAQTGVCFGTLGDNLPPPGEVVALCKQHNIQRMRLYNPNQAILQALRGSGISVIVGVPNEDIQRIAQSVGAAQAWLQQNILNNAGVDFRYIAVGNEISPLDGGSARIAPCVPPAMYNIKAALNRAGLGHKIKVSTALSTGILAQSFPPSAGSFRPEIRPSFLDPIIEFLVNSQFPLLLNVYTYFPYIDNLKDISLEYATFTSPSVVVRDGPFQYQNLFDAIVDATYAALEKAGGANVEIVVSESGWPSAGGTATSVDAENARVLFMKFDGKFVCLPSFSCKVQLMQKPKQEFSMEL